MKTHFTLSRIALAAIFVVGVFAMPMCNSNNKPPESAVNDSLANKMMSQPALIANDVQRGRYLVAVSSCNDCHTPKIFTQMGPVPDSTRLLSGHPADGKLPKFNPKDIRDDNWVLLSPDLTACVGPWGISYSANLTPDSTTGLGAWNADMFIKAMHSGKHMGVATGRDILPPMPVNWVGQMTDDDLNAVFAYLHSLKPIVNRVPTPVSPHDMGKM